MSTELQVLFQDNAYGELVKLPTVYKECETSTINAEAAADKYYAAFSAVVDISKISVEDMEAILTPMRKIRVKLSDAEKAINDKRSPHTRFFDKVGGAFISLEKRVKAKLDLFAKGENLWQTELLRRKKAADDLAAQKLLDAQAKIQKVAAITKQINERFVALLVTDITGMTKKFYEQSNDKLFPFVIALKKWKPVFKVEALGELTGEIDHIGQALLDTKAGMELEYPRRLREEIEKLEEAIPGRIAELGRGEDSQEKFLAQISEGAAQLTESMNEEVNNNATVQSMNASFTNTVTVPILDSAGGKGKAVKKKYQCDSHEALQVIAQSWFTHNFKLLSLEEANKKLSFMRTAADERLNNGQPVLQAKGLSVIDDVRTKINRDV